MPVLVKDGKPCSASSSSTQQPQIGASANGGSVGNNSSNGGGSSGSAAGSSAVSGTSSLNLITGEAPNSHSPDTSSTLLASYNGTVAGHNAQMLQQPCNNSLMSNSLAMAYRNQNNFMTNGHQQQCGGYLPLQGRAW